MTDELFIQRCIELAATGLGTVAPNPMVGAVIVHDGKIIGEGYHRQYGQAHAEVNAIYSVKKKQLLKNATLYVNLEPCSHFGKTPPCTRLIIQSEIPRVVIGCKDFSSKVNGKGMKQLRDAGVQITFPVLEREVIKLNKFFFTYHRLKRPYIILKWAQSSDGFIGKTPVNKNSAVSESSEQILISNEFSQMLVHKWRSEVQAILVGTNTALLDNPQLNVRQWKGKNPIRLVIDKKLRLPLNLHLFDKTLSTLVFTFAEKNSLVNLEYIRMKKGDEKHILQQVIHCLYQREIQSLLVEGGAELLGTFIDSGLWDEARVITAEKKLFHGIKAPEITTVISEKGNIGNDEVRIYQNNNVLL